MTTVGGLVVIFTRSSCQVGVAALLLCTASALRATAAESNRLTARFEIYGFAGLHVLTNRTSVDEAGDQYAISMDLDTRGLASVFVDLTSHSQVRGKLTSASAQPESYRAAVRRNGADRQYQVDYGGDGSVINASASSPIARPILVAAEQIHGTVDQLTAYFLVERQLARGGPCALVVPVFDGSGLYNLHFADVKRENLAADGYQNFAGPSQVCTVAREDIVANPDRNEDTYRWGKIWYARVIAGDRLMPVRLEFDTAFGAVKGYLAELRGRGVNIQLMRE